MPPLSEPQRRAMFAAANGHSTLGIPKKVGEEFVGKTAKDMKRSDWRGFLRGLLEFISEEANEPAHTEADDETKEECGFDADPAALRILDRTETPRTRQANDMALDRDPSHRHFDTDGRLHVASSNISKATVNDYYGEEIPGWQALGLEARRKYAMLRDPAELQKAAPTFNNLPVLSKHVATSAEDHPRELVIGSTGTDATFDHPYLKNSLVFWPKSDIDKIENDEQRELSCSYHYDPDMTPGTFEGKPHDGVMRNIRGNHVALVPEGRAGPDVLVSDSAIEKEKPMSTLSTGALILKSALFVKYPKLVAMDAQLTGVVRGVTGKKFADQKKALAPALHGLLASDAALPEIHSFLDSLDKPEADAAEMEAVPMEGESMMDAMQMRRAADARKRMGRDETPEEMKARETKEKKADDEADAMWRKRASDARARMGRDESEEESDRREEDESASDAKGRMGRDETPEECGERRAMDKMGRDRRRAMDKAAKDNPSPVAGEPTPGGEMITKGAMDAAINDAVQTAVQTERNRQTAIHAARTYCQPWVGAMDMAFDSAEQVYGKALHLMGKDTTGVPAVAFKHVLDATPKPGSRMVQSQQSVVLASDAAGAASFFELFPGAEKIGIQA